MAIVYSQAVGTARKSLGTITYQTYKGRTIAKGKINVSGNRKTTNDQHLQRARMSVVGHFAKLVQIDIKHNFLETKVGYQQANFIRTNFITLSVAFDEAVQAVYNKEQSAKSMSFDYLNNMIKAFVTENPDTIVYSNNASTIVFVNPNGWPTPPAPLILDTAIAQNPPLGDPLDLSVLPRTVGQTYEYTFTGSGLSRARLRLTISGNVYIGSQFQSLSETVNRVELKANSTIVGTSVTKVEYLDEEGTWQVWSSSSVMSMYKKQGRNLAPPKNSELSETATTETTEDKNKKK